MHCPVRPLMAGEFIGNAIENGAAYIVCSEENIPEPAADVVFVAATNPKETLGRLASARFGTKKLNLQLVGVTGTNGKTTVTSILEFLFAKAGRKNRCDRHGSIPLAGH